MGAASLAASVEASVDASGTAASDPPQPDDSSTARAATSRLISRSLLRCRRGPGIRGRPRSFVDARDREGAGGGVVGARGAASTSVAVHVSVRRHAALALRVAGDAGAGRIVDASAGQRLASVGRLWQTCVWGEATAWRRATACPWAERQRARRTDVDGTFAATAGRAGDDAHDDDGGRQPHDTKPRLGQCRSIGRCHGDQCSSGAALGSRSPNPLCAEAQEVRVGPLA